MTAKKVPESTAKKPAAKKPAAPASEKPSYAEQMAAIIAKRKPE